MPNDYDTNTVVIGKRKGPIDKASLNREIAKGNVEITKKDKIPSNARALAKIADETEVVKVEHVGLDVAKAIQQGRQDLGISQKDLATKINVKPIIINELEAGKAIPDNAVLGKLERELKIKLRGSNIGAKLEAKAVAKK